MSPHLPQDAASRLKNDDIYRDLLKDTQAYLEFLASSQPEKSPPSPPLTLIDAWNQFYDFCTPLIRHAIIACHVPEADQSDCVQEVWKEVVAKLHHFVHDPERGRLNTWLYTLAHNKAVDLVRRRTRHPAESLTDEVEAALSARDADPAAEYERCRTQAVVRSVLAELSQQVSECNYRILHLRWIEGRTVSEIGAALGLTPAQVRFRHHRVKKRFRELFGSLLNKSGSCD